MLTRADWCRTSPRHSNTQSSTNSNPQLQRQRSARAEVSLPPKYRGEGMPFDEIVAVDTDARSLDRLLGFLGRGPNG